MTILKKESLSAVESFKVSHRVSSSYQHIRAADLNTVGVNMRLCCYRCSHRSFLEYLKVPFLSMVTRRSCLLCDWVQLMTGSVSPSSVVGWATVSIWIWLSCWAAGPSIAAVPQSNKNKLSQNVVFLLFFKEKCPKVSQFSKTKAAVACKLQQQLRHYSHSRQAWVTVTTFPHLCLWVISSLSDVLCDCVSFCLYEFSWPLLSFLSFRAVPGDIKKTFETVCVTSVCHGFIVDMSESWLYSLLLCLNFDFAFHLHLHFISEADTIYNSAHKCAVQRIL